MGISVASHDAIRVRSVLTSLVVAAMLAMSVMWAGSARADEVTGAFTDVNIVQTTSGEFGKLQVDVAFTVPEGTVAGDTATLTIASGPFLFVNLEFDVLDPDTGEVVGTVEVSGNTAVLTFTDYVEKYDDIDGTFTIGALFKSGSVEAGDDVDVTFESNGETFPDTVTVVGTPVGQNGTRKQLRFTDPATQEGLSWVIVVSTLDAVPDAERTITITDTPGEGNDVDCDSVIGTPLNIAIAPDNGGAPGAYQAIPTSSYTFACGADSTGRGFILSLEGIAPDSFVRVRGTSTITDSTLDSYKNSAVISIYGQDEIIRSGSVRRFVGEGNAQGTAPTPTPTPTPSETPTPTPTPTPSETPTPTPTPTPSETPTPSVTPTPSITPTPSVTPGTTPPAELARTGGSGLGPILWSGASLLLLGLAMVLGSGSRTRRIRQH